MKKTLLSIVATTVLITSVSADVIQMVNAGVGYSSYEYDFPGLDLDSFDYSILDLSYNIGWDRFYVTANAMLPMTKGENTKNGVDAKLDRSQYSLNLGYALGVYNMTAFTGINYVPSTITFTNSTNIATVDFVETGIHVGIAGSLFQVENVGVMTAKIALSAGTNDYGDGSDSSIGYLFGLGWIGNINENMTYYVNLDGYGYSYTASGGGGDDYSSTSTTLKAGVGYMF